MKRLLAALAFAGVVSLSGCTWLANTFGGTPDQPTKTAIVNGFLDACTVYESALKDAIVAQNAHLLSASVVADIHAIRPGIESICPPGGAMPSNLTAGLVTVAQGTAQIIRDVKGLNP